MTQDDAPRLPHDPDSERALLGVAFSNPEHFAKARPLVKVADFYRVPDSDRPTPHAIIFRAICAVLESGSPLNLLSVKAELDRTGKLEDAGGVAYLASLDGFCPKSSDATWYAMRVRDLAKRRELGRLGATIEASALNGGSDAELVRLAREWSDRLRELEPGFGGVDGEDLAEVLGRDVPPIPWAIEHVLAEGDIAIVSGPGGIGKTWLVYSLALSLASGWPVFGAYDVKRHYRVAVLDLESRPWEVDLRLKRLCAGMGFGIENARGRLQIIRQRLRLDRPEDVRRLTTSLREWRTEFLIVDSFRRMTSGDVNRAEVVAELFSTVLDPIRLDLGCGVVITDHTRKKTGEDDLDADDQALIGTVDKRNMADAHFGVHAREERVAWNTTKTRHSRLPDPILLETMGLEDGAPDDGPVTVRCVGKLDRASDKVQDAILALLDDAGEAGVLRGEILGRVSYSKRSVTEGLSTLAARGKVSKRQEGKQTRYYLAGTERAQRAQTSARRVWEPE